MGKAYLQALRCRVFDYGALGHLRRAAGSVRDERQPGDQDMPRQDEAHPLAQVVVDPVPCGTASAARSARSRPRPALPGSCCPTAPWQPKRRGYYRQIEEGAVLMKGLRARNPHFTGTHEQSMALDGVRGFHIVLAVSGMCDAGHIRHRLRNWIWREEATVLFTGYQTEGTQGRILQNAAQTLWIQGEEFSVGARIRSLDLYSGHADGPELANRIKARLPLCHDLFPAHGEQDAIEGLAVRLGGVVDAASILRPMLIEAFDLTGTGERRITGVAFGSLAPSSMPSLTAKSPRPSPPAREPEGLP